MIELTLEEIGRCLDFSYKVTARTEKYYKTRNKYASTEKLIMDCFIGKLAELAVFKFLQANNRVCSYPSFETTFCAHDNADIRVFKDEVEYRVHCKVSRHDSPVRNSWLIQKKEIPLLNKNDFFVFCEFYSPTKIKIIKMMNSQDIEWKKPRLDLPSKMAYYL